MNALSVNQMTKLVTSPYRRGAEIMEIPIGVDTDEWTIIESYEFTEYKARYQADPEDPKYIFFVKNDAGNQALELQIEYSFGGVSNTVSVNIPENTNAGTSFVVPTPTGADASLRILRFKQIHFVLPGQGKNNWGVLVLLGNMAKLFWVLGLEKDFVRQQLLDIRRQRCRDYAHSFSLDKLGEDLRVPRFPPREYSYDKSTIVLYHLNDPVEDNGEVFDETSRFGLAGHPGTNRGAQSGVPGKFGNGFRFPGATGEGSIEIPNHTDFDIPSDKDFKIEAFMCVDAIDSGLLQMLIIKGDVNSEGMLTTPGWLLSIGDFRGIENNLKWAIYDGTDLFEIYSDTDIADGKFHLVACIIDCSYHKMRLFVDGIETAKAEIEALGSVANGQDIRIGRSNNVHQFFGVIDEVRFSNKALCDFHPVLCESGNSYRQRLGIFEHWLLPTSDNLAKNINKLVQINGEAESFEIIEKDQPRVQANKIIRVLPSELHIGQSVDSDGNFRSKEEEVTGLPEDDKDFKEIYLLRHENVQVNYGLDVNNHLMQAFTKCRLDELLDLLSGSGIPGNLIIVKSYDQSDSGLHRVGRALELQHESLTLEQLGVLVHKSGFNFVKNYGTHIYASVAIGEKLQIVIEPRPPAATPPEGIDVFIGKKIDLHFLPESLLGGGEIKWTLIPCGSGRAFFESHPGDQPPPAMPTPIDARRRLRLVADSPGEITVKVEYTYQRRTISGTRTIRISIARLKDGESIAENGDLNISEKEVVGYPEEDFDPIYLITHNAGLNYGTDPNNKKMQIVLEKSLNRLIELLGTPPHQLEILKGYSPANIDLNKVGRALLIKHASLDGGILGAFAHMACFSFVKRQGPRIYCSVVCDDKIEIVRASDLTPITENLISGNPIELRVRFSELPVSLAFNIAVSFQTDLDTPPISDALKQEFANNGFQLSEDADLSIVDMGLRWRITDRGRQFFISKEGGAIKIYILTGSYNWSVHEIGNGSGEFDFVLRPQVNFTPKKPGLLQLNITYLKQEIQCTFPYTFEIKLKNSLDLPQIIIPKHQYDLIMNILNYFHPIGTEVITRNIREHVVEVRENLLNAFPGYTYPDFRE